MDHNGMIIPSNTDFLDTWEVSQPCRLSLEGTVRPAAACSEAPGSQHELRTST